MALGGITVLCLRNTFSSGTHALFTLSTFSQQADSLTVGCRLVDSLACFCRIFLPNKAFFKTFLFFFNFSGIEGCDSENKIGYPGSGFFFLF